MNAPMVRRGMHWPVGIAYETQLASLSPARGA